MQVAALQVLYDECLAPQSLWADEFHLLHKMFNERGQKYKRQVQNLHTFAGAVAVAVGGPLPVLSIAFFYLQIKAYKY